jgi:hypothetical protein
MAAHVDKPLIEDDPPSTLPRGQWTRRPSRPGSGQVMYFQLYLVPFIGIDSAVGIWMKIDLSLPPIQGRERRLDGSSLKRLARRSRRNRRR